MQKTIELETYISEKEFVQFNFYAAYSSKIIIYITVVCILLCLAFLFVVLSSNIELEPSSFIFLLVLLNIVFYIPFSVYNNAKKNYRLKGARFTENMQYTIDDCWITIKGESFETTMNWDKVLSVKETNNWFLIYENKMSAHIINKRLITEDKITDLRTLIDTIPDLKTKLK